ncbi:CidA/LrgA family protein [Neisseriaceae bacterium ESL0693]|nr:CidA/LrgA family protein [Neisseriaceae bacterium ESL0693]
MNEKEKTVQSAPILFQMLIFAAVLFVSQFISNLMPSTFPLPTPVVGLVLLYLLLTFHVIKLEWVDSLAGALIGVIGFLFVPSGISLAEHLNIMETEGVRLVIVIILSTVVLLVVTAYTTRILLFIKNRFGRHASTLK